MNQPKYPHVDWMALKNAATCGSVDNAIESRLSALAEIIVTRNLERFGITLQGVPPRIEEPLYRVAATADINKNGLFVRRRFRRALRGILNG